MYFKMFGLTCFVVDKFCVLIYLWWLKCIYFNLSNLLRQLTHNNWHIILHCIPQKWLSILVSGQGGNCPMYSPLHDLGLHNQQVCHSHSYNGYWGWISMFTGERLYKNWPACTMRRPLRATIVATLNFLFSSSWLGSPQPAGVSLTWL